MKDVKVDHGRLLNQGRAIRSQKTGVQGKSFDQVLNEINNNQEITFSKHAIARLKERNIELESINMDKLKNAFQLAGSKGVRDAIFLMDEKVFVASIKNKTIITAASEEQLKDNVFTNIDGAVIL